jgi:hypothetical protein
VETIIGRCRNGDARYWGGTGRWTACIGWDNFLRCGEWDKVVSFTRWPRFHWEKTYEYIYGGIKKDELETIIPYGSGWLMGISSNSYPLPDPSIGNKTSVLFRELNSGLYLSDYWLVAANHDGTPAWQLSVGGFGHDSLRRVVSIGGNVLAVGSSGSKAGEGNRISDLIS